MDNPHAHCVRCPPRGRVSVFGRPGATRMDNPHAHYVRCPPRGRVSGFGRPGATDMDNFGMDTISLAGALPDKLAAIRAAGFSQVMLSAADVAGYPGGIASAADAVRASGLRITGFQVLRDFEGLAGDLHEYKLDIAKAMLEMCSALGCPVLLACSSTSSHAAGDRQLIARDLRKLALLALPLGIRVAYEALSWGRHIDTVAAAWEVIERADCPNLGLGLDSFHLLAVDGGVPQSQGRPWTVP